MNWYEQPQKQQQTKKSSILNAAAGEKLVIFWNMIREIGCLMGLNVYEIIIGRVTGCKC